MTLSTVDIQTIRQDFPVLQKTVYGKPLVYFDTAATAQKPKSVISAEQLYYTDYAANVHRGVHYLSAKATEAYEDARKIIANCIQAESNETVFVKGSTDAINLVAQTFVRPRLSIGDEILISALEHHANLVPWQLLCEQTGAILKVCPLTDSHDIDFEAFKSLLTEKTRFVAMNHVSNVIGTTTPIKLFIQACHKKNIPILVDGAQAVVHQAIDVKDLDCDFYVFSGHKLFGPTGIGVLYGKYALLSDMPPYQGGGDMVLTVSFDKTTYQAPPLRFEAGTPNIAGAIGLAKACEYLLDIGLDNIATYEHALFDYLRDAFSTLPGFTTQTISQHAAPILSFTHEAAHPHDIATILDQAGVAIRAGHHCAMPLIRLMGLNATTRASLCFYNTVEEVDIFIKALKDVTEFFS